MVIGALIGILIALIEMLIYPKFSTENHYSPPPMEGMQEPPRNAFKGTRKSVPTNPPTRKKNPPAGLYWAQARALSTRELHCLALNIYHEARGEPHVGKVGVGQVTVNRADVSYRKKTSICGVVYDPYQFTWALSQKKRFGMPQGDAWEDSQQIARDVANGLRVQGLEDSLHYHATYIPRPAWSRRMTPVLWIGQHIYLNERS